MDINTAAGEKVVYIDENGYDRDKTYARKYLKKGEVLTVEYLDVGQSSSTVTFKEIPHHRFNTVMFKNATPTWERFHWFAHCYIGIPELTQTDFADMPFEERHMSDEVVAALEAARPALDIVHTECEAFPEPEIEAPIRYTIMTMSRGSSMELAVINPTSEEHAHELFMNQFGYEPTVTQILFCGNTFHPADVSRYTTQCNY